MSAPILLVLLGGPTLLTLFLLVLPSRYSRPKVTADSTSQDAKTSVQILVLGDIGRSPRMQFHAMSIARHGGRVEVVGYLGTATS